MFHRDLDDERETIPVRELLDDPYFTIVPSRSWMYLAEGETIHTDLSGSSYGWSALCGENWGEGYVEVIEVPATSWGDYGGDDVGRSNFRVLLDEYPDTFIEVGHSSHDGQALYLPLDAEIPAELFDRLMGLSDYPLLDESDHSELRMEIATEDWETWARDDFRREIQACLPDEAEDGFDPEEVDLSDDVLNEVMWEAMRDGDVEHEVESATSGYFRGLDELAKRFASELMDDHRAELEHYANQLTQAQYAGMAPLA